MSDSMLGKVFALCDYREQAEFLNTVGKTLRQVCDNEMYADMQLCRIVDQLDDNGRKLIKKLADFVDLERP